MNKERIVLEQILKASDISLNSGKTISQIHELAQQALSTEVTDPRRFSELELATLFHDTYERLAPEFGYATREDTKVFDQNSSNGKLMIAVCKIIIQSLSPNKGKEEVMGIVTALRGALVAMNRDCDFLYAIGEAEQALNMWDKHQSISPNEWKEEVKDQKLISIDGYNNAYSEKSVLENLVWATEYLLHNKSYDGHNYEELQQCVVNAKLLITSYYKPIEPNQTEAEKETIEALAEKEYPKEYGTFLELPRESMQILKRKAFIKGHSLGRTTTIQEIEELIRRNSKTTISARALLTKLQTLKP